MTWLKENWFKVTISLATLIGGTAIAYNFGVVQPNIDKKYLEIKQKETALEEQKELTEIQLEADRRTKQQQAELMNQQQKEWINNCMTDAYTELKTLQHNFDVIHQSNVIEGRDPYNTSEEITEKARRDAFANYESEWVPQCKLGNRVFLDYEWFDINDFLNN